MEFHYGQRVTVISVSPTSRAKIGDKASVCSWRENLVEVCIDGIGKRLMWKWQIAPVSTFETGSWAEVSKCGWMPEGVRI